MSEFAAEAVWIFLANGLVATVLALGAWIAQRCDRPRLVHALCVLALVKLVTPPLWAVPVLTLPAEAAPNPVLAALLAADLLPGAAPIDAPPAVAATIAPATAALFLGLLGTVALVSLAWQRTRRFRRLIRVADAAPPLLRARAAAMASRVGLSRCPELLLLPARISPMLCLLGGRTLLLLPRDLLTRIGDAELDALLTHELAHAERRDHWVRVLELVAFALYWWLPTAWWLRRALHAAEERCCDARVLALHPLHPRAYADALLHTLDFLAGANRAMPPVACGASAFTDLKKRLTTIMTQSQDRPLSRLTRTGLLALAVGVLPVMPSFAQEAGRADETKVRAELRSAAREVARLRAEVDAIRAELQAAGKNKDVIAKKHDVSDAHGEGAHQAQLKDEITKAVREATKNIKVNTEALHKALAEQKIDAEGRHVVEGVQLDPESIAQIMTHQRAILQQVHEHMIDAHDVKDHVAEITEHATRAAQEAMKKAQAAHGHAMAAHEKAARQYAADAERGATEARDAGAADEHRKAVVERLRKVERSGGNRADAERARVEQVEQADAAQNERAETRARRADDRREAEMKAIEAEMQKLQRKLEALRRQGEGDEARSTRRDR